jgi:excisionase family DNA binding protein
VAAAYKALALNGRKSLLDGRHKSAYCLGMPTAASKARSQRLIPQTGRLLTYHEVAALLGVGWRTVMREADAGHLQRVKVGPGGSLVRITEVSVERYIKARLAAVLPVAG